MIAELILSGLLQGLVLAFVAFGVMIPFRLLNFPDLTAEGAYPLGGTLCAVLLMIQTPPLFAVGVASLVAGFMGIATAYIHLRLRVNTLLAGIIVSTMLYSVNLRLMGKPNVALFAQKTLFSTDSILLRSLLLLGILSTLLISLFLFLRTKWGLRLRAVGLNPEFATRQGFDMSRYTFLGLFLGSCCVGLAGSLTVQLQSYADIGMGVGIVIHALAALMIGESLIGSQTLGRQLLAPLIGALIYQQIQGFALFLGLVPSDLKLFTGITILTVIALGLRKRALHS